MADNNSEKTAPPVKEPEGTGQHLAKRATRDSQPKTRENVDGALVGSGNRYQLLVENSNDIIYVIDKKGHLIYVNPAAERVFDYPGSELLGKHFITLVVPEHHEEIIAFYNKQYREKIRNTYFELPVVARDGTVNWIGQNVQSLTDGDGKVIGYQAIARDITERRQMEALLKKSHDNLEKKVEENTAELLTMNRQLIGEVEERRRIEEILRESEEKYRSLATTADLMYLIDRDCRYLFMNEKHLLRFGMPLNMIIGRHYGEFHSEKSTKEFVEKVNKVFDTGAPLQLEYRSERDGRYYLRTFSPVKDQEGKRTVAVTVVAKDIDDRKRAEELYKTLADSSQAGVYISQNGKLKFVNPHIAAYTGYTETELIGMSVLDLAHPDDLPTAKGQAIDMLKGRRTTPYAFRIIDRHGRVKWLMETVRSITYEGNRAVLGNTMDVTERYQMEKMLRQAQKMEAIGTLAGGIAHDFNNILTAIIGHTEIAHSRLPGESPVRRNLEQVLKAGSRATDLVSQILSFSRQTEQERKPVQVAPIVKEALKLLRSSLPRTIEIRQEIDIPSKRDTVLADPTQIHQVLMNLCTNASHAMRDKGGVLTVQLSGIETGDDSALLPPGLEKGPYVRLSVSDTGHGMDAAVMEKIFDPYFTTKGPGEGTGLGLSVVQGIVRGCGGAITVHSEPDRGTIFHAFFPGIEEKLASEERAAETIPAGDERILFVDDEKTLVELGKEMLEALGYNVTAKTNCFEALETFRSQPHGFDLVFTDMTMPGLTGTDLARELMAIRPDIPIILFTGFSELIDEKRAKAAGIREFLMKPFLIGTLSKTVRKVLD